MFISEHFPLPVSVNERIECQSISPACGEVGHCDITIPTNEQFAKLHVA